MGGATGGSGGLLSQRPGPGHRMILKIVYGSPGFRANEAVDEILTGPLQGWKR